MQEINLLFVVFEMGALCVAFVSLWNDIFYAKIRIKHILKALCVFVPLFFAVALGEKGALFYAFKIFCFVMLLCFAIRFPGKARFSFFVFMLFESFSRFFYLGYFSKHASIHFFLLGCLFFVGQKKITGRQKIFFVILFLLEICQALFFNSRATLLFVLIACGVLILDRIFSYRIVRGFVSLAAAVVPLIYYYAMYVVHEIIVTGSDLIEPTISNVERSWMIAWCIDNFFSFFMVGPAGYLSEMANTHGPNTPYFQSGAVDPHSFLLSSWMWLGAISTFLLYFIWCKLFVSMNRCSYEKLSFKTKYFAMMAFYAISLFVTTPPSAADRIKVALVLGISIAGLRNSNIFEAKCNKVHRHENKRSAEYGSQSHFEMNMAQG